MAKRESSLDTMDLRAYLLSTRKAKISKTLLFLTEMYKMLFREPTCDWRQSRKRKESQTVM